MVNSARAVVVFGISILLLVGAAALVLVVPASQEVDATQTPDQTVPSSEEPSLAESEQVVFDKSARSGVTGWMPYWATAASLDAVVKNREAFRSVSPFWFQLTAVDGKASVRPFRLSGGATREDVRDTLKENGLSVIPSIVDESPARFLAEKLRNSRSRTAIIKQLVNIAVSEKYDGLDLDLENFAFKDGSSTWARTRPAWVSFVRQLSKALKAQGKVLTVTTPPIYNRDYSPSSGYWVYDWESIAPYVSRLRVMTYDFSFDTAGPIGPLDWTAKVMDYASTVVPARKVEMGVPAYGRNWVTRIEGNCPSDAVTGRTLVNMQTAEDLAVLRRATPRWDPKAAEATFSYSLSYSGSGNRSCTVFRTVWFPTPQSLAERSAFAASRGLGGIAIWSLPDVSAAGWDALRPQ